MRAYMVKRAMTPPADLQTAVAQAVGTLNTVTVPMGLQHGTDSGKVAGYAEKEAHLAAWRVAGAWGLYPWACICDCEAQVESDQVPKPAPPSFAMHTGLGRARRLGPLAVGRRSRPRRPHCLLALGVQPVAPAVAPGRRRPLRRRRAAHHRRERRAVVPRRRSGGRDGRGRAGVKDDYTCIYGSRNR